MMKLAIAADALQLAQNRLEQKLYERKPYVDLSGCAADVQLERSKRSLEGRGGGGKWGRFDPKICAMC